MDWSSPPSSIFTAHLPQRPLNQVQAHQTRQGLRPDFAFHLPSTSGQPARTIADIKTISLGNKQLYRPGCEGETAVKRRACKIQGEYRATAEKLDRELGFQPGMGPTVRKLSEFPPVLDLVFGAYGETSEGVKSLLDHLVKARLQKQNLRRGTTAAAKESSIVTGYLRRRLSTAVIRANVSCLLDRLTQISEGEGQPGKKREWDRQEEERGRLDRESQWLSRITGEIIHKTEELFKK